MVDITGGIKLEPGVPCSCYCVATALLRHSFWDGEFCLCNMHFQNGERMGRYWAMSASGRLTFSWDISSQLDFTLKGQKGKLGWFWALCSLFLLWKGKHRLRSAQYLCCLHFFCLFFPFVPLFLLFNAYTSRLQRRASVLWETRGKADGSGEGRGCNS